MVSRIVPKGCPKCGGALKEDPREKEWSCMNCGMLRPAASRSVGVISMSSVSPSTFRPVLNWPGQLKINGTLTASS